MDHAKLLDQTRQENHERRAVAAPGEGTVEAVRTEPLPLLPPLPLPAGELPLGDPAGGGISLRDLLPEPALGLPLGRGDRFV